MQSLLHPPKTIKDPPAIAKKMFETGQFSSCDVRRQVVVDTENSKLDQKNITNWTLGGLLGFLYTLYTLYSLTSSIYTSSKHRRVRVFDSDPSFFPTQPCPARSFSKSFSLVSSLGSGPVLGVFHTQKRATRRKSATQKWRGQEPNLSSWRMSFDGNSMVEPMPFWVETSYSVHHHESSWLVHRFLAC